MKKSLVLINSSVKKQLNPSSPEVVIYRFHVSS